MEEGKGLGVGAVAAEAGTVLRAVRIRAALLTRTGAESKRAESNTGVGSDGEHAEGMSMDARIRLRVDKHTGGP